MTGKETISVVMATRNAARYLPEALASIAAQTRPADELVIVDKDSADDTVAIAEHAGARVIPQRGSGFAGAWNEGIEAARGSLIAMLDSDDRWDERKLEIQEGALAADPALGCVVGHVRFFTESGEEVPAGFNPALLDGDHLAQMPGALLARRPVFDEVGLFPTDYEVANDIEWFSRLKDSPVAMGVTPGAIIEKRVHGSNLSYTNAGILNAEVMRLLRASVARKREAEAGG